MPKIRVSTFLIAGSLAFPAVAQDPVPTPAANAPYEPAFPEQTRAPQIDADVTLNAEQIVSGLDHPWAVQPLPEGGFIITERPGNMRVLTADGTLSDPLQGLPEVDARGQGGLLDVTLSPDFADTRMIYWSYAEPRGENTNATAVARGVLSEDNTRVDSVEVIFQQQPAWQSDKHFGSRLVFAPDGTLFITLGERSDPEPRVLAQDPQTNIGKLVRVNADGSIPEDNPDLGLPSNYAMGLRNIQAAALDSSGQLWTVEHGPQGGDELNMPEAGKNYGWPTITYGIEYAGQPIGDGITEAEGMEQPVYYWDPVIAPSGALFYQGDLFDGWKDTLVIGALNPAGLVRLTMSGGQVTGEARYLPDIGRIRDVAETADGAIWVVTDEDDGGLYKVTPQ
ncbi:PQQ-dependent sugar dehydrogenase [Paracoccaceae bacterium GXU_MW_L88]